MENSEFSAVIKRKGRIFVSQCPELDLESQGCSIEEAICNLEEAIEVYLEDESETVEYPLIKKVDLDLKHRFPVPSSA